nr:hypothetical protein GCM10025730_36510 [Promicromonospora thailandica]
MAVFAFSVAPMTAGESVAEQVAEAVRIVRESGLPNRTTSMFTEIEGSWDEVMPVIQRATDAVARGGHRVSLVIKADIRPGAAPGRSTPRSPGWRSGWPPTRPRPVTPDRARPSLTTPSPACFQYRASGL